MRVNNFLSKKLDLPLPYWSIICPVIAIIALLLSSIYDDSILFKGILAVALISAVLAAVYHAEMVAHKVGEPFGTIILALAITILEVSLIVSIMLTDASGEPSVLARDTVFAALMIILNGIIGLCLLTGSARYKEQNFVKQGVSTALITLVAISILTLILPNFLTSGDKGEFSSSQLIFVAIISLILYSGFITVQTIRHREYFVPQANPKTSKTKKSKESKPNLQTTIVSLILLILALIAVILLSKKLSPTIEDLVINFGAPKSLVGIIIATVILLPEGLSALKAARKNRLQTSLNLALGSALASIGLSIPAVAAVCYFAGLKVTLGIDAKSSILLVLSLFSVYLSLNLGRTNIQQGIVLLTLFATYLFTTIIP